MYRSRRPDPPERSTPPGRKEVPCDRPLEALRLWPSEASISHAFRFWASKARRSLLPGAQTNLSSGPLPPRGKATTTMARTEESRCPFVALRGLPRLGFSRLLRLALRGPGGGEEGGRRRKGDSRNLFFQFLYTTGAAAGSKLLILRASPSQYRIMVFETVFSGWLARAKIIMRPTWSSSPKQWK